MRVDDYTSTDQCSNGNESFMYFTLWLIVFITLVDLPNNNTPYSVTQTTTTYRWRFSPSSNWAAFTPRKTCQTCLCMVARLSERINELWCLFPVPASHVVWGPTVCLLQTAGIVVFKHIICHSLCMMPGWYLGGGALCKKTTCWHR